MPEKAAPPASKPVVPEPAANTPAQPQAPKPAVAPAAPPQAPKPAAAPVAAQQPPKPAAAPAGAPQAAKPAAGPAAPTQGPKPAAAPAAPLPPTPARVPAAANAPTAKTPDAVAAPLPQVAAAAAEPEVVAPLPLGQRALQIIRQRPGFLLLVVLPFLAACMYYGVVASDRYVGEAKLLVKRINSSDGLSLNLGLLAGGSVTDREDALYLREYILSPDMAAYLDQAIGLRGLYGTAQADWLSRLAPDATREEYLDFFRQHVHVHLDDASSVVTLQVEGFDPGSAKRVAEEIIQQSDRFINAISNKVADDQMDFVNRELESSRQYVLAARAKVNSFQDSHRVLDPVEEAKAAATKVAQLEAELSTSEAELKGLLTYLNSQAPQVVALRGKLDALRAQIMEERRKLAGGKGSGDKLNRMSSEFQKLAFDAEFALERHKVALQAMEKTRIDASKRIKSLVVLSQPQLAEEARYPRRIYILSLLLAGLLMMYGIVRLGVATIKDHTD